MKSAMSEKRVVPPVLKGLLRADAALTSAFCHALETFLPPVKSRKYLKLLEISCHGLPWLATWIAFFWILWNPELFEMQVNFLFGLVIDLILVTVVKALARRRRPPGNKPDMFMAYGTDVYSFPSGHVSRAVLITVFFSQLYPTSSFIQLLLYLWVITVAISRILLKRHYILDVVGGAFLGFLEVGLLAVLWMGRPTAVWLVTWISEENVSLEGLHDASVVDAD